MGSIELPDEREMHMSIEDTKASFMKLSEYLLQDEAVFIDLEGEGLSIKSPLEGALIEAGFLPKGQQLNLENIGIIFLHEYEGSKDCFSLYLVDKRSSKVGAIGLPGFIGDASSLSQKPFPDDYRFYYGLRWNSDGAHRLFSSLGNKALKPCNFPPQDKDARALYIMMYAVSELSNYEGIEIDGEKKMVFKETKKLRREE